MATVAMNTTERILHQAGALVGAIEALETIERTGPIEKAVVWLPLQAQRPRLRAMVETGPEWVWQRNS